MSFHYLNSALPTPALQIPVASIPFPKHVAQEVGWLWFHTSKNESDAEGIFRSREVLPFSRKLSTPPSKYLAPYLCHLTASFTVKMKRKSCFFKSALENWFAYQYMRVSAALCFSLVLKPPLLPFNVEILSLAVYLLEEFLTWHTTSEIRGVAQTEHSFHLSYKQEHFCALSIKICTSTSEKTHNLRGQVESAIRVFKTNKQNKTRTWKQ